MPPQPPENQPIPKFNTITGCDWKRSLKAARIRRNRPNPIDLRISMLLPPMTIIDTIQCLQDTADTRGKVFGPDDSSVLNCLAMVKAIKELATPDQMTLNAYQQLALRTAIVRNADHDLLHAGLGMATEAAEFLDVLKKEHAYGKIMDRVNLVEEVGDLLWYCALACRALDIDLQAVANTNIEKLRVRYPEKYTDAQAITRNIPAERSLLETGCATD